MASNKNIQDPDLRLQSARQFAETALGPAISLSPLTQDASFRRYFRIRRGAESWMLMDAPPDRENTKAYVTVDRHLERLSFCVPKILAQDETGGYLLLEDFGDQTFTRLLDSGEDAQPLYGRAVETLARLNRHADAMQVDVPHYSLNELLREAGLLVEWFHRLCHNKPAPGAVHEEYLSIWTGLIESQPAPAMSLTLRDFHVDNLMLVHRGASIECGLLDFQDAVIGPMAYDLMSLLQDARRDL
ncbi:MAG: phosphotransferase, partial [Thiohalobacterales bacterium]|nr:phosphotransferase [Thiohalobacterales bacterium]